MNVSAALSLSIRSGQRNSASGRHSHTATVQSYDSICHIIVCYIIVCYIILVIMYYIDMIWSDII